jgi:hypothetical protein
MKTVASFSVLLLLTIKSAVSSKNINMLLMEQIERDPSQWPALIAWANQAIFTDGLLPAGYKLK